MRHSVARLAWVTRSQGLWSEVDEYGPAAVTGNSGGEIWVPPQFDRRSSRLLSTWPRHHRANELQGHDGRIFPTEPWSKRRSQHALTIFFVHAHHPFRLLRMRVQQLSKLPFVMLAVFAGACFLQPDAGRVDGGSSEPSAPGEEPTSPNTPVDTPGDTPVDTPGDTPGDTPAGDIDFSPGEGLLFLDRFDYDVPRDPAPNDDTNYVEVYRQAGWSGAKCINCTGRYNGYIYTADAVPGHAGPLPSTGNVLVMEALPDTLDGQTDFYLQYGSPAAAAETVPGDVWFQFWILVNNTEDQPSGYDEGKFIYACNDSYPCNSHKWLFSLNYNSKNPHWDRSLGRPTDGSAFLVNTANTEHAVVDWTPAEEWDRWKLGQQETSTYVAANRWQLVRVHMDTSTTSGTYEAWIRPFGESWVQVASWVDGVTENFTWRIFPDSVGGHRMFRMPTTYGRQRRPRYDTWTYIDDFAMATNAAALPIYPDEPR